MAQHQNILGKTKGLILTVRLMAAWSCPSTRAAAAPAQDPEVIRLAQEVASQGWIVYAAKSAQGDYDLFASRPDGSSQRNLTRTPNASEYGGRFSPDGKKLLYRRAPRGGPINHDLWGALGCLVIANANGSNPVQQGGEGEWPWASWSPDAKQVACLYKRQGKFRIIDLQSRQTVKELPRQGIFQQLFWSPDGKAVCGTANLNGQDWNIISIDLATGKPTLLSRNLNCTADWFQHDPQQVIYSNRTPGLGSDYGWTMLMQATADGQSRSLIYAEGGRHVYYGCTSPDDHYAIFSLPTTDGGTDAPLAIIRLADAPLVVPANYAALKTLYPKAKSGPVLRLPQPGFEPHWTFGELD